MKTQPDCIIAETYLRLHHAQQPPRPRARDTFEIPPKCDTVYPPPSYTAVNL